MELLRWVALSYVIGLVLTWPLTKNAAMAEFVNKVHAGKMQPGSEGSVLVIAYVGSALVWPIVAPMRAIELYRERSAERPLTTSQVKAAKRRSKRRR